MVYQTLNNFFAFQRLNPPFCFQPVSGVLEFKVKNSYPGDSISGRFGLPAIMLSESPLEIIRRAHIIATIFLTLQYVKRFTHTKKGHRYSMTLVGMARFELAASSSRTKRATGLRYIPFISDCKSKKLSENERIFFFRKVELIY